jgi:ATP-dependent Clp protease ATP-binding subunit ClpC
MPEHEIPLILVTQRLDGDFSVGEALHFPEVLALHTRPERIRAAVRALAREILAEGPPLEVHRRVAGEMPVASVVAIEIEPPRKSAAWIEPISLRFHVLRWRHGEEGIVARVPALAIEVMAAREGQLDELIPQHIRAALARSKVSQRLLDLAQLARVESVSVERATITAEIRTPAQIAAEDSKEREEKRAVIEEAGVVLSDDRAEPAYEIDGLVKELSDALVGANSASVLLVGPPGVGKTAAFVELFRQRRKHRLGHAPFWTTSGSRLIAGTTGYGLWQERCQRLCREAKREEAILHLGNLVELMEVGKGGGSQFGIANFFRPYLARGDVVAVAECAAEQIAVIEKANPHLLSVFRTIHVEEPSAPACRLILHSAAVDWGGGRGEERQDAKEPRSEEEEDEDERGLARAVPIDRPAVLIGDEAIEVLERLHRRYASYSAAPGRPLRFLRNLLQDQAAREGGRPVISARDVTAAFSRETGLPLFFLDDAARLDLAEARARFGTRVIGQSEAVELVADLLATIKAALNRPRRPIASLLFIGPTGVGKTEMAKALAEYFFGDIGRLVRFDMSEFATPSAVSRLIGTAWESEGLLTSKVREQPFCVILFDEFEKAHPAFFDLLLGVLGEGRLTDAAGRLADFSNAIVVMTSNLGAATFGAGAFGLARATSAPAARAREHFTDAVREHLRPELFNRIDRIVPFLPLDEVTIEAIAAREIELIARRDGVRERELALEVSPEAIRHLARSGYDPMYGARPLKRRIERDLLAPLADAVNQYAPRTALSARVGADGDRIVLDVRAAVVEAERGAEAGAVRAGDSWLVASVLPLRRRVQAFLRCPANLALENELFTLERLVAKEAMRPGRRWVDPAQRERLKRLREVHVDLGRLSADVTRAEDELLLHAYEGAALERGREEMARRLTELEARAHELQLALFTIDQPDPHGVTLGLFSSAAETTFMLAGAYAGIVEQMRSRGAAGASIELWSLSRQDRTSFRRTAVAAAKVEEFLSNPRGGIVGVILALRAPYARSRFETETGLHVIEEERNKNAWPILVDASAAAGAVYEPPKDFEFRVALAGQRRRTYRLERREAEDVATNRVFRWTGRDFSEAVAGATEEYLRRRADAMLEL